jgi:hypothetical protein
MKSLRESLFDSKIQTMESLFDKDLVEKDLPSFKDIFKLSSKYRIGPCSRQFSYKRLKKDIKVDDNNEAAIILNSIAKIIGDIKLYEMDSMGPEEAIAKAISPYVLSSWKPFKQKYVSVWNGKNIATSYSSHQFLDWDEVQIDILGVSLMFERK